MKPGKGDPFKDIIGKRYSGASFSDGRIRGRVGKVNQQDDGHYVVMNTKDEHVCGFSPHDEAITVHKRPEGLLVHLRDLGGIAFLGA